jgi:hypothetical protein
MYPMDEWTIKTPNPKCQLFFKIYLLTDFAALCLTDFIDWRYIHSWLVFSNQLVNCSPIDEGPIIVYCCPSTFSLTSPPPFQTKCTVHTESVWLWGGGGGVDLCCRPYSADFFSLMLIPNFSTLCFWPDSEPTKLLPHPKQKWPVKTTLRDVSLKFLRPWYIPTISSPGSNSQVLRKQRDNVQNSS